MVASYAETSCGYGWDVPIDTVISFLVTPTVELKFDDVKLEESKYQKRRDVDVENIYYYVNSDDGINWTVDTAQRKVMTVEYYPSNAEARLKCPPAQPDKIEVPAKSPNVKRPTKTPSRRKQAAKFACPIHPEVVSSIAGFCPRCGAKLRSLTNGAQQRDMNAGATPWPQLSTAEKMTVMERLSPSYEYTCLMHREVHAAEAGVCPKCGMTLVTVDPSVRGEYKFLVTSVPQAPRPGESVQLRFTVTNPQSGEPVKDYLVVHEKLFHLFIVSQDLSEYQHIHPKLETDGTFSVETILPRAGSYKIHADFFPVGGLPQIIHRDLMTAGYTPAKASGLPALAPDAAFVKTTDGLRITLEPGGPLVAGTLIPLTYRLADARTGEPVRDLEPYLGAWGHTLILNADQSQYLHTHPAEMLPSGAKWANLRGGPNVDFKTMFPAAGDYRIWTQFQRGGKVSTVVFTVRIAA